MGPLLKDMPLVASFVDSRSEGSGTSFSGEDYPSPSESERGGQKGVSVDRRGKRRVKNRDAARKSRKKQTERADILHQELQTLERSNSALEKEIAGLRREFRLHTATLEQHEPLCTLRPSSIPANAPCFQILSPSASSIAPVTTPGPTVSPVTTPAPTVSPQTTPGSLLTPVTGGQLACLPAPASLPLSTLVTVPSTAHVTNPYPLLSTLYSPISNISPNNLCASLITPKTNICPLTTSRTNLALPNIPTPTLSSTSYPLTMYPLNLSTPAIETPIELSLSDILDSPDWLCDPASPNWGEF
ncbi:basic leucine zipper transcriptional factor ATF-like 2 [Salmo salar]|uniref:Basic leucine zipper transcriptional factor ATF-like 2 n=1 Tax=Salmo salar TaxID=8030 RepID=A0A1S3N9I5_SALSA|nr:basic leucine zipper transcriptional factor ATF-like 2 [Salmo salar]|eukprot:XP_014012143.1 PREDICTED: basic leucine zipper transcriptional factor ATF-like 2 [Salmo salar]